MRIPRLRPLHWPSGSWRREDGNFIVFTAFAMVALIGMMSLVIDIGFDAGQRRFMQNGADAAALAVADKLAGEVQRYPAGYTGIPQYFSVPNATVLALATDIAQRNQSAGITGRTTGFTVLVEYCVAANSTSYSTAAGCPSPNSWVTSPTTGFPPDGTYKVRVTVTSTITTFFGGVIGKSSMTTNGQAIAVIRGVCPETTATGNIWPMTLWDQQNFGVDRGQLYELWGPTAPQQSGLGGSWQNLLDLTPAQSWCNGAGTGADPIYTWANQNTVPSSDGGQTVNCTGSTGAGNDTSWNRNGYAPDPRGGCYTGTDSSNTDIAVWAAATFQGTLRARSTPSTPDGNKFPTYQDANPGQSGNGGSNVANGIYGPSPNPCANTYFFAHPDGASDPDYPGWGPYRDVVVFTYNNPEWATKSGGWATSGGGAPDRVELIKILHFRIYQGYCQAPQGKYDPSTPCSSSRIKGRSLSIVAPPNSNPPLCQTGPNVFRNVAGLGS